MRLGLEILCNIAKIDYSEMAKITEVSRQTFNDWLRGKRKIPSLRLQTLSEYFNVRPDILTQEVDEEDFEAIIGIQIEYVKNNPISATEIASISGRNRTLGIHPLSMPKGVLIMCTLSGGTYPNKWLDEQRVMLKYYLQKQQNGVYNPNHKNNQSVIKSSDENYPIYVFVRNTSGERFRYEGEFTFNQIIEEEEGRKFFVLKRKIAESYEETIMEQLSIDESEGQFTSINAVEGKKRLKQHYVRERDPKIIKSKIESVLKSGGLLECYCCGFNFEEFYGDIGEGIICVHHTKPISEYNEEGEVTTIDDLEIVCYNCHRIIHRKKEYMPVDELRQLIESRRH